MAMIFLIYIVIINVLYTCVRYLLFEVHLNLVHEHVVGQSSCK